MVSRWVACWWSCYRRRTSWCTLEREGDMGWCKRCLIGWWWNISEQIGGEICLDAHDRGMWTKSVWAPELKPWLVTKADGRMVGVWSRVFGHFGWHVSNLLIAMKVGLFWFQWLAVLVVFEFVALDFLSTFFGCFTGCFFGSEWLYMWPRWTHILHDLLTSRGPSYFQMLQDLAPKLSCSGWVMPPIMDDESIRCRIELVTFGEKKPRTPRSGCQGGRGGKVSVGRRNSCSNPNEYLHVIKFGKQCKG